MPSKWIEHIKDFAKSNGMSYKDALKDPKCKSSYHEGKGNGLKENMEKGVAGAGIKENIELKIEEKGGKRGRPPKYFTDEDRKKAKSLKTMESNKRKKAQKNPVESSSESESEGKGIPNPLKETKKVIKELKGKGIIAGYKTENDNGLGHIYPISHELVLQMLKQYI
jgi:hypothetical protein